MLGQGKVSPFNIFFLKFSYEKNTPSFPPELSHFFTFIKDFHSAHLTKYFHSAQFIPDFFLSPAHERLSSNIFHSAHFIQYFHSAQRIKDLLLSPVHTIFSLSPLHQRFSLSPVHQRFLLNPVHQRFFSAQFIIDLKKNILYKTTGAIANPSFGILFFSTLCHPHYPL